MRNGSSFIQDNWLGNKILVREDCNYTTYIVNGEEVSVPFVGEPPEFATDGIAINATSKLTSKFPYGSAIDYAKDGIVEIIEVNVTNDIDLDILYQLRTSLTTGNINFVILSTGSVQMQFRDNSNNNFGVFNGIIDVRGTKKVISLGSTVSGSDVTFTLYVDGVPDGTKTVPIIGGWLFERFELGDSGGAPFEGKVYCIQTDDNGVLIKNWRLDTRLQKQGATQNEIVDVIGGRILVASDVTQIFPNVPIGSYLLNDKQLIDGACVTIPAGEQLVIDELTGDYETKNGAYVLKDIP